MTEPLFNPYEVLGVSPDANDEAITAAYRRAAREAHPDRPGGSTERMTDVNMAYKILADREMRARYDADGSTKKPESEESKAREMIVNMLKQIIRNTDPYLDMLSLVREALKKQLQGCAAARQKTFADISMLRVRLQRLKGPPDNFIQIYLEHEIARGEALFPTFDADERVMKKALEVLEAYRYGDDLLFSSVMDPMNFGRVLGLPNG